MCQADLSICINRGQDAATLFLLYPDFQHWDNGIPPYICSEEEYTKVEVSNIVCIYLKTSTGLLTSLQMIWVSNCTINLSLTKILIWYILFPLQLKCYTYAYGMKSASARLNVSECWIKIMLYSLIMHDKVSYLLLCIVWTFAGFSCRYWNRRVSFIRFLLYY